MHSHATWHVALAGKAFFFFGSQEHVLLGERMSVIDF